MPIPPLKPPITYDEVQSAEKPYGKSNNLDALFKTLLGMNAFQDSTAKSIATRCIYFSDAAHAQNNREWGDYRFERLRNGRSSATKREVQYFHDAFAHVFSPEWAAQTSLNDLVTVPLGILIRKLQRKSPISFTDPTKLAFALAATDTENIASFELEPDGQRWGVHGSKKSEHIKNAEDILTLPAESYFSLTLKTKSETTKPLVLQITDEALDLDGKLIRAQRIDQIIPCADGYKVTSYEGEMIRLSKAQGRFHYLALFWEGVNDMALPDYFTEEAILDVLNKAMQKKLSDHSFAAAMISYRVS